MSNNHYSQQRLNTPFKSKQMCLLLFLMKLILALTFVVASISMHISADFSSANGEWTMSSVGGHPTNIQVRIAGETFTFRYCNSQRYFFNINNEKIHIKLHTMTRMMCFKTAPTEEQIRDALTSASTYTFPTSNSLILKDKNGTTVALLTKNAGNHQHYSTEHYPLSHESLSSIAGQYRILKVNGKSLQEVTNVKITKNTIEYTYCNGHKHTYTIRGGQISVIQGASTEIGCVMTPSEDEVKQGFVKARTFTLHPRTLTLYGENGKTKVVLLNRK